MRVVTCLVYEHDLWLVAVAALVCGFGAYTTVRLFNRIRHTDGMSTAWLVLGALAAGSAAWCTHFIAMLAFQPSLSSAFDPMLTALSLAVAVVGAVAGFMVGIRKHDSAVLQSGVIVGLSVAAMHYLGMAAYTIDALVTWHPGYVASSVALVVGIAPQAFVLADRAPTRKSIASAAALLMLAIVSLHFIGMAAVEIVPLGSLGGDIVDHRGRTLLAVAVGLISLAILGTLVLVQLVDRQTRILGELRWRDLMDSTVDGMVVTENDRIADVNAAFERLIGLEKSALVGTRLEQWTVEHCVPVDLGLTASTLAAADGQEIKVEIAAHDAKLVVGGAETRRVYAVRDIRARLAQQEKIDQLARQDPLTGLMNRSTFVEDMSAALAACGSGQKIALLALDIDRFRDVNDLYGHATADQVLVELAGRMRAVLAEGENLARLGDDKFVAMGAFPTQAAAEDFARRLKTAVDVTMRVCESDIVCGARVGIALYPDHASSVSVLLNNADLAMYRAMGAAQSDICCYDVSMDDAVRLRRRLVHDLREACDRNQLELRYQPQFCLRSGDMIGCEVLIRWKHPELGYIAPSEFIPLAESSGLILHITRWVLVTACAEAAKWPVPYRIAVNISAIDIERADLPKLVHETLLATGLAPARLEIEVTETAIIQDAARSHHVIRQLKALGVTIALDDFGSGYSSLGTLRTVPCDKIKLDKTLVQDLERDRQARAIVRAVLALGECLDIVVLAEGVETEAQLALLVDLGCAEVQGYLLGRPEVRVATSRPHYDLPAPGRARAAASPHTALRDAGGVTVPRAKEAGATLKRA